MEKSSLRQGCQLVSVAGSLLLPRLGSGPHISGLAVTEDMAGATYLDQEQEQVQQL